MRNKLLLTAATATVLGMSALTTSHVFAQTTNTSTDPMPSLVEKIANRFGLKKDEVQAVFDQARSEHEAQREADYAARLTKLVTDGKITEAQKQLIITKQAELATARNAKKVTFQNMTTAERKATMVTERAVLKAWADTNGIDLQYLMPRGPGRGRGGPEFAGEQPPQL